MVFQVATLINSPLVFLGLPAKEDHVFSNQTAAGVGVINVTRGSDFATSPLHILGGAAAYSSIAIALVERSHQPDQLLVANGGAGVYLNTISVR
jgi:hypothetical protein